MNAFRIMLAAGLLSACLTGCGSSGSEKTGGETAASGPQAAEDTPPEPLISVNIPFTRVTGPQAGEAQGLTGKGGTFPVPLYKKWFEAYAQKIGVQVSYEGVGSSEGIKKLSNREVDFGASDVPMTDAQLALAKGGAIMHIPTAFGAIAIAYNVPGITGRLKFTAQTLSGIYQGDITRWNDPQLVRDNPQLASVRYDLIAVHRADGSGTTYGFTDYLSTVNPAWMRRSGRGASVYWYEGIGSTGSGGMAKTIRGNPYSLGYVELGYAKRSKLAYGLVQNRAGRFVEPTIETIVAAAGAIGKSAPADLRFSIVNASGENSYPLCTGTWLLAYKNMPDLAKATALTRLLRWATTDGQAVNADLNYAPVPNEIAARSDALIRQIGTNGQLPTH
jgi:phosphate transport system substrate-binding protein